MCFPEICRDFDWITKAILRGLLLLLLVVVQGPRSKNHIFNFSFSVLCFLFFAHKKQVDGNAKQNKILKKTKN